MDLSSVNLTPLAKKADVLCEIARNDGHCMGHDKVTKDRQFGTNRKPVRDFLLAVGDALVLIYQ